MIALAALLAQGPPSAARLASHPQAALALRLLSGERPRRLAAPELLLAWAAEAMATPPFLLQACLQASGEAAEVAALLLPAATGAAPDLAEVLSALAEAQSLPPEGRRALWLGLALRLPPPARHLLNRLAAGTFRTRLRPQASPQGGPRRFLAVLTMIAPQGPLASFALRHGNGLVPIAKLPLALPETAEILAWARAQATERFGPNWAVPPVQVFTLSCAGTSPNPRRKSGLDLAAPRLLSWNRDARPDDATTLDAFRDPVPFSV